MERDGVIESRFWIPGDTGRYDCSGNEVSDERPPGGSSWISSFYAPFDPLMRSFCVSFAKNHVSFFGIAHFSPRLMYFPAN